MASAMITIYHLIFRVSHLERSDLQIGRHAHRFFLKTKNIYNFQSMFIFSKYDQIHNSEYFQSMIIFKTILYTQPYITVNVSIQCISPHSMSTHVTLSLSFAWVTANAMREGKCLAISRSRFSEGDRPIWNSHLTTIFSDNLSN